jgi:D-alanyl-D-alanine carboxypeptidase
LLTEALYATDQQGNKTQMAYFLTKPSYLEQKQLRLSMKAFDKAVLTSKAFRNTLKEALPDN